MVWYCCASLLGRCPCCNSAMPPFASMQRILRKLCLFLGLVVVSRAFTAHPISSAFLGRSSVVIGIAPHADDTSNDDSASPKTSGQASIPTLSVSLVKSIVGGGVLALPSGMAAMGGSPDIVPTAITTILASGALNAFYFGLVGKVCDTTEATSYKQAWERTVGSSTSPLVTLTVTLKTALSCLAYSMILADSGQALANASMWTDGEGITRTQALLAITGIALVPLTLQRNLKALAPFSLVGLLGMLVTTATIVTRCQDGSYRPNTGVFVSDLPTGLQPTFGEAPVASATGSITDWPGVVLLCTLATAFVAHYNAPRFYNELQDASVQRFQSVAFLSYAMATVLFVVVGCCGFLTFGQAAQGYILNNYSPNDSLATISKTALAGSILLTYPLPFVGLRDGTLDLLQVQNRQSWPVHTVTTVTLLAAITAAALAVQDLALVLSVGGGTFSTAVSAVFPVCMFLAMERSEEEDKNVMSHLERVVAALGMLLSVGIGVEGVHLALTKAAAAST